MITIDNEKLIEKLAETCINYYHWEKPYFVVSEVTIMFPDDDINNYFLTIAGRAGGDETRQDTEISFEVTLNPKWSYDFIQGYFQRVIEEGEGLV